MPVTLPDGTEVPTTDDINKGLDNPQGNQGGPTGFWPIDLWDFLFGNGHAGSCGAFRDQYFSVKSSLDGYMDEADKMWSSIGVNESPTPTDVMAIFGPVILATINQADAQFDQFKGSNLLGQTMFASRLHFYIFKRWMGSQVFGVAQWAQERYLFMLGEDQKQGAAIIGLQGDTKNLFNQATLWNADHQFIVAIQGEVAKLQTQVDSINNVDIPGLKAMDASLVNAINNLVDPAIARAQAAADLANSILTLKVIPELAVHQTQIHKIKQKIANRINPRIHNALQQLRNIGQNTIPQIDQQLQSLQNLVPQVLEIPQIQQSLITLGQQISQQEQQKTQTILPQLLQLAQALTALADQIQNEIVPHQELHDQQITNINEYLTTYVDVELKLLLSQTTDIYNIFNTVIYPQISIFQDFITNIDLHIKNVLKVSCSAVWDCITQHRQNRPDDVCEEGRTWWGTWAECWLDAHTSNDIDYDVFTQVPHSHLVGNLGPSSNVPALQQGTFHSHLRTVDGIPSYIFAPEPTV